VVGKLQNAQGTHHIDCAKRVNHKEKEEEEEDVNRKP